MAMRFVLVIGVMSFFADFTYEGAGSVYGPFLAGLAASATVVSIVTGFGELVGYGFRLVSGRWADRTGNFWPIAIFGYFVQLLAVPALALVNDWPMAAALIILERFGRATRNPPRDAMLSHAGSEIGFGWAFGVRFAWLAKLRHKQQNSCQPSFARVKELIYQVGLDAHAGTNSACFRSSFADHSAIHCKRPHQFLTTALYMVCIRVLVVVTEFTLNRCPLPIGWTDDDSWQGILLRSHVPARSLIREI
jgi:hypothetical protein